MIRFDYADFEQSGNNGSDNEDTKVDAYPKKPLHCVCNARSIDPEAKRGGALKKSCAPRINMQRLEISDSFSAFGATKMKTVPGGTFGLALGFFYTINVVVGTGFLGIPYAFYKGGVVVCALAMIVIAFTSVVTTLWVLETMSRAQALERHAVEHEYDDDDEEAAPQCNFVDVASESEDEPEISDDDESGRLLPQRRRRRHSSNATPTYEIRSERKFDFPELCQRFLGPVGKYTYTTLLSIGVFLNLWTMTSIAATAWSVNVPLRRDWWPFRWPCDSKSIAPEHGFHPDGNCWNNYAIFVLVFALVVTPLSMLDLKRQRFVQVGTGVMRVVVVVAIIVYCIVADVKESSLSPTPINGSTSINRSTNEEVSWIAGDSFIDFLVALPILSYTLAIQVNVPTLSQPMEPKRKLKPFYIWLYVFLFGFYFSLGVAVLAYLKSSVAENCTLYWVRIRWAGSSAHIAFFHIGLSDVFCSFCFSASSVVHRRNLSFNRRLLKLSACRRCFV